MGAGNAKITSLTSDADGEMLFAGSSDGKIQVRIITPHVISTSFILNWQSNFQFAITIYFLVRFGTLIISLNGNKTLNLKHPKR